MGAPLTVGYGEGENYLGSDALALAPLTQKIAYLEEGDWAVVKRDPIQIYDRGQPTGEREIVESGASSARIEKGNYRHYMQKEIFEQPIVVAQTSKATSGRSRARWRCRDFDFDLVHREPRHDRRLRHQLLRRDGRQILVRAVRARCRSTSMWRASSATASRCSSRAGWRCSSRQTGETADTLAALRHAREEGQTIAVVVNVPTQLDGARGRPAAADPCRPGDRRRLDQGLHLPAGGAGRAGRQPRPRQGRGSAKTRSGRSSTISRKRRRR